MITTTHGSHAADMTVRIAQPGDAVSLDRLAQLDSARPLDGEVVVAESHGEIVAAMALATGRHIADPFRHTAWAIDLLSAWRRRSTRDAGARRPRALGLPAHRRARLASPHRVG